MPSFPQRESGIEREKATMCRNIKPLFNFDPPVTDGEIHDAALQFVRKISGFQRPSRANEAAFTQGVEEIAIATRRLVDSLVTELKPKDRETEIAKAHLRAAKRFG